MNDRREEDGRALRIALENQKETNEKLTELLTAMALVKQSMDNTEELVKRHDLALFGNGKPGLLTDMAKVKSWIHNANTVFWAVICAGAVSAAAVIARVGNK